MLESVRNWSVTETSFPIVCPLIQNPRLVSTRKTDSHLSKICCAKHNLGFHTLCYFSLLSLHLLPHVYWLHRFICSFIYSFARHYSRLLECVQLWAKETGTTHWASSLLGHEILFSQIITLFCYKEKNIEC